MGALCVLVGLILALIAVAVIGHGLWLAGAAIFGTSSRPTPPDRTLHEDRAATLRQLTRLKQANKISDATWEAAQLALRDDANEIAVGFAPAEKELEVLEFVDEDETIPTSAPIAASSAIDTPLIAPIPERAAAFVEWAASMESPVSSTERAPLADAALPREVQSPRSFARLIAGLLQAFMEEKNIRWGELISGLLIVGSSVGLVISLWATLKRAIPYFPVAVFLTATIAMHGAGLYTLRRWRLRSTSRGLLLISTLLIPLNVLAAMVLNEKNPAYTTIDYVAFAVGLSVLSAIAASAARVLNRRCPWPTVVAVVGTAIGMSTIGRLARPGTDLLRTLELFALPFLAFLVGALAHIVSLAAGRRLTIRRVAESFRFYGIASFGLVLAGGLLASKCGDVRETLTLLSPVLAAVAATLAGAGLIVHQRVTDPARASFRLAGTSIALGGGVLASVALALAWPRPDLLVAVGLLDAIAFTGLACFAAFPALHLVATASFTLAFLIGFEWATGAVTIAGATTQLWAVVLLSGRSALIVVLFSLAADVIGIALRQLKAARHGAAYFASAMLHEAVGIAIAVGVVWKDRPDQDLATLVFALAAIRWLVAAWFIERGYASWIAATLLLAAISHGLAMNDSVALTLASHGLYPTDPWKMSLLVHATICLGCAIVVRRRMGATTREFLPDISRVAPFAGAAIMTSTIAVPLLLDLRSEHFLTHGVYAFWTAAVWFAIALLEEAEGFAVAAQILATIGVGLGVTGVCHRQLWWTGQFGDPLFLNWQFGALAVWSGMWIALRRFGKRSAPLTRILKCEPTSVDRLVLGGVAAGLVGTCLLATWPGIVAELASVAGGTLSHPGVAVILVPFGIGAVFAATLAMSEGRWLNASAYVLIACVLGGLVLSAPLHALGPVWPGFPSSYGHGWGAGAWIALPLVLLAVTAAHWERSNRATIVGLGLVLSAVPFLVACRWDADLRTATALRWATATAGLAVALVWSARRTLVPIARQPDSALAQAASERFDLFRNTLIAATTLPLLILTSQTLIDVLGAGRVATVAAHVFTSPYVSYTAPLGILAAGFVVYAIAERRALWGLAATFVVEFAVGFAVGLALVLSNQSQSLPEITRFLQQMGLLAVTAAAVWCGIEAFVTRRRVVSETLDIDLQVPIATQLSFVGVIVGLLTVGTTIGLWLSPNVLWESVRECGGPLGWTFVISATLVWTWAHRRSWPLSAIHIGLLLFSAASVFAAASLGRWNSADNWLSFHTALVGWCAVLALGAAASVLTRSPERRPKALAIANRALFLLPVILIFAAKAEFFDPQRPWWAAGAVLWLSVCMTALAVAVGSRTRSYVSFMFAILGSVLIGVRVWLEGTRPAGWQPVSDLADAVVLGIALHGLVWLAIELWLRSPADTQFEATHFAPPVHHSAAAIGTLLLGLTTLAALAAEPFLPTFSSATALGWAALGTLAVLAAGSLWERRAEHPFPILYSLGLVAIAMVLDWRQLDGRHVVFTAAASGAGYVLLSGFLWSVRHPLKEIGLRLRISEYGLDRERVVFWLAPVSLAIGVLVICVEFAVVTTFDETALRVGGALATLALGVGLALFATSRWRNILQTAALAVGAVAAVQFGWSLMEPFHIAAHQELPRAIRMMTMLATTTFVYGLPLVRLAPAGSSWFKSICRTAIGVAASTIAILAVVLVYEITSFSPTAGAPETVAECLLVGLTLASLAAGLISLALLPGRDPFFHSERQRFLYVYAAEAVAGLLFAHLYLTNPEFFRHTLQPYWPLVVMGIAFAGTAVSELFRRLKINVLAEPLESSAAFLPVLPVIGFWFVASQLNYSTVLVVIGLLYLFLSLRRGSFVYPAATAVVGNAALCSLLSEQGVSLLFHPQMFVIPPCLTVLAAAQLNRDRLDVRTLGSLRYFAMTAIYVSSTGEMFQHGIGTTLWLPMVLAGLSVAGVLAGIVLRVRAFLYLGTSFLLLSIVSMVWHAARSIGHVWPWWVFLFTLGVGLLTLFGVFEKKRPEVLALVGSLRDWER